MPFGPGRAARARATTSAPTAGCEVFEEEHAEFFFGRDARRSSGCSRSSRRPFPRGARAVGQRQVVARARRARAGAACAARCRQRRWRIVHRAARARAPLRRSPPRLRDARRRRCSATLDGLAADPRDAAPRGSCRRVGADAPRGRGCCWSSTSSRRSSRSAATTTSARAFFATLLYAAAGARRPRRVVVLTMRADFYPRCAAYPELAQLVSGAADPRRPAGRATGCARRSRSRRGASGWSSRPGLVDTILDDVGGAAGRAAAARARAARAVGAPARRRCSRSRATGETGGVAGRARQARRRGLRGSRARRSRRSPGGRCCGSPSRARAPRTRAGARRWPSSRRPSRRRGRGARRLVDARLLTTAATRRASEVVEVSHEALIRGWPRLRDWIDEDRAGLRIQRRLTEAAREWERARPRRRAALPRRAAGGGASSGDARNPRELNDSERAFLAASERAGSAASASARRRARTRVWGAAGLVLVVAAVAAVAVRQRARAAGERGSRAPRRALALARERVGAAAGDRPGARAAARPRSRAQRSHGGVRARPARRAAVADPGNAARAQGTGAGRCLQPRRQAARDRGRGRHRSRVGPVDAAATAKFDGHKGQVYLLAFSRDGKRLASAGADGDVRVWPLAGGEPLRLRGDGSPVRHVEFNADGTRLLRVSTLGTVELFDASRGSASAASERSASRRTCPRLRTPCGPSAGTWQFNAPGSELSGIWARTTALRSQP